MKTAVLQREASTDLGTPGVMTFEGEVFQTGELPWVDNEPNISCVPAGTYTAVHFESPTHGACLMLQNVPHRSNCEIHAGNWFGSIAKGYRSDVLGCIVVGLDRGTLLGQQAVTYSKDALLRLLLLLGTDDMELTIKDAP